MNSFPWWSKRELQKMHERGASPEAIVVVMNEFLRQRENRIFYREQRRAQDGRWRRQAAPQITDKRQVR